MDNPQYSGDKCRTAYRTRLPTKRAVQIFCKNSSLRLRHRTPILSKSSALCTETMSTSSALFTETCQHPPPPLQKPSPAPPYRNLSRSPAPLRQTCRSRSPCRTLLASSNRPVCGLLLFLRRSRVDSRFC